MQLEDYLGEISKVYGPRRAAYLASAAGLMQSKADHHGPAKNLHGSAGLEGLKQADGSPKGFLPAIRSTSSSGQTGPTVLSLRKPVAGGFNINALY